MTKPQSQRIHVDKEPPEKTGNRRRPVWIAAAAVAITIGLIGWLPALIPDGDLVTAVEPTVPTTPATTMTVSEPPPRITAVGNDPVLPEPADTGLGRLVWKRVDQGPIPTLGIQLDLVTGGFYGYDDNGRTLRSADGVTWTMNLEGPASDTPFYQFGKWGFTYDGSTHLHELVDGEWQEVDLAAVSSPEISGLAWELNAGIPVEAGNGVVIPFDSWSRIPWEEVYGLIETGCSPGGSCSSPPYSNWNPFSHLTEVKDPGNGRTIDTLRMKQAGSDIVFTNTETSEVVWTVEFPDPDRAGAFVFAFRRDQPLNRHGLMVGPTTQDLELIEAPWTVYSQVLINADNTLLAYESLAGETTQPQRVWSSTDGIVWVDEGAPEWAGEDFGWADVQRLGDRLIAGVSTQGPIAGEKRERWVSADGIHWDPYQSNLPPYASIDVADFGYIATNWGDHLPEFWVSADGEEWEEIPSPKGDPGYAGYTTSVGVAGDLIYMTSNLTSGSHPILWVARFE